MRRFFTYLVLDEVHEEKGADTAQGHAAAALAASCQKVIALTGTLIGGYAEHLRPLLFRLAPRSLVREGLGWSNATAFNERYGRIETRITERSGGRSEDNRMSRGSKSTTKCVRPGIMPALFGRNGRIGAENGGKFAWAPSADISETEQEYLIRAELPAVKKEDVKVTLDQGMITIHGERKEEKETREEKFHRVESFRGAFSRSFSVPENIDEKAIRADSKDGVLTVHLPKARAAAPRAVEVKVQ